MPQTTKSNIRPGPSRSALPQRLPRQPGTSRSSRIVTSQQTRSRPPSTHPVRPATSVAIRPPTTRFAPTITRPGTSASNKMPTHPLSRIKPPVTRLNSRYETDASKLSLSRKTESQTKQASTDDLAKAFGRERCAADILSEDFRFEV